MTKSTDIGKYVYNPNIKCKPAKFGVKIYEICECTMCLIAKYTQVRQQTHNSMAILTVLCLLFYEMSCMAYSIDSM